MWRRFSNPDILIFLDVSYPVAQERRKLNWTTREYEKQTYRLRNARQHADLYLDTDELRPEEILKKVLSFIAEIYNETPN
jgi:thymidylate kinase